MPHDVIVILDYGSQYAQLIARRVREAKVYCEIFSWRAEPEQVLALQPKGFILSGGPNSVYDAGAPPLPDYVLASGAPILGICYGMQLLMQVLGGHVAESRKREYGPAHVWVDAPDNPLFQDLPLAVAQPWLEAWMSHGDRVERLAPGFYPIAHSDNSPYAGSADSQRRYYAVQFHPEVAHTPLGHIILRNFVSHVCGCSADWTPTHFIDEQIAAIRAQVGSGRVVLGLSGGVDSTVAAALLHRAIGDQLTTIFVNHGLLRQGEATEVVETVTRSQGIRLIAVNAVEEFLEALDGVSDPETKRKIIGEKFIRVFEREALRLGHTDFLAQGTIYPDIIESAGSDRPEAQTIKTHHNVGGLPADMQYQLVGPLRRLFKDEVRRLGQELGLPDSLLWRQPFPGPGLAIRCLGQITWERLETLRRADAIFIEELRRANMLQRETQQAFAVLLPVKSVGVMGDERTYREVVALRAVTTEDFMTADWARLPYELLARVSRRIVNEVPGVNRVVLDITSKPPGTIAGE